MIFDLDGTVIKTDSLWEMLFSHLRGNPFRVLRAFYVLIARDVVGFKAILSKRADREVANWPMNSAVVELIEEARACGSEIVLATAAHQGIAKAVNRRLQLFDRVIGSSGRTNLKGEAKLAWIQDHYDLRSVGYVGDCQSDIPIWRAVHDRFVVDSNHVSSLTSRVSELKVVRGSQETQSHQSFMALISAIRPHQWLKNLLVMAPALLYQPGHMMDFTLAATGALIFSIMASSVYLANDLSDLPHDREHPRKKRRAIASGDLSLPIATLTMAILWFVSSVSAFLISVPFGFGLMVYFVATAAYSFAIKSRKWADVCLLSGLYTWRIICGGLILAVPISNWLIAFSLSFFLGLALLKRLAEVEDRKLSGQDMPYGRAYSSRDRIALRSSAIVSSTASLGVLAMYSQTHLASLLYASSDALLGVVAALAIWFTRLLNAIHRHQMLDDPIVYALRDPISWIVGAVSVLSFGVACGWF